MPSDKTIDADDFAVAVAGVLGGVENHIEGRLADMVGKACKVSRDVAKEESPKRFGGYAKGWAYSAKPQPNGVVGEVGNKKYPGLVHLLEKGHAKCGGGRVDGIVHVATAYAAGAETLEDLALDAADAAVSL